MRSYTYTNAAVPTAITGAIFAAIVTVIAIFFASGTIADVLMFTCGIFIAIVSIVFSVAFSTH